MGKIFQISEVKTRKQFYEMKDSWDEVLNKSPDDNIFLTWEKMAPSVNLMKRDGTIKILCATEANELVGIAPFRITRGSLGYRIIEPLTNGETDYTGLIMSKDPNECLQEFLTYLFSQKDWDFILFPDLPQTSQILELLRKTQGIPAFEVERGSVCPYIEIPDSKEKLLSNIDPKLRKKLKKSLNKLEREQGKVEIKQYYEIGYSLGQAIDILVKLHQKRWTTKGKPGRFTNQNSIIITLQTAKYFAEKNWLRLYFLTVKGKVVAVELNLEYKNKMYCHLKGFEPGFSMYRVGSVLTWKVLEECISRGIIEYDLMQGDESYKFDWTNKYRQNISIKWVNQKTTSKLMNAALKVFYETKISSAIFKNVRVLKPIKKLFLS